MHDVREICPGVCEVPGGLCICPGCGVQSVQGDPESPEDVADWCKALFAVLRAKGIKWATQAAAEELASNYMREPWHDE